MKKKILETVHHSFNNSRLDLYFTFVLIILDFVWNILCSSSNVFFLFVDN
uniref:Uncharacterized protein n=1 Tax=Solanum lycopersicum TaxID=4081 RepID=A0A3Q7EUV3_SOLLC